MHQHRNIKMLILFIISLIIVAFKTDALEAGDIINYDYKGEKAEYVAEKTGLYKLEVWGAEGGYRSNSSYSGKGGFSQGTVKLNKGDKLYIYVGGAGGSGSNGCGSTICPGGFNGGGYRYKYYGGGGATDIRINEDSLYARVIVAGGGGSDGATNKYGMAGGGTTGLSSTERCTALDTYCGKGGASTHSGYSKDYTISTQTKTGLTSSTLANYAGGFGFGGGGTSLSSGYGGAGGGGWYGGSGTIPDGSSDDDRGGGGGSGYVYTEETASDYPEGGLLNSKYYLKDASTIAGNVSFASPQGANETGHIGNGYARITYLEYDGPGFSSIDVDGCTIDEPIEQDKYEYHIQIPEDNYRTSIAVTPYHNEKYVGVGEVTLSENTVHHIIVINDDGDLSVYNLIPYVKRADLEDVSFAEIDFDFVSYIHEYNLKVSNGVKNITPIISAKDGITYKVEGDLRLKVGNNVIRVIATDGDVTTTYTFNIDRAFNLVKNVIEYTGESYEYIAPGDGVYTFELWGASGGYGLLNGNKSKDGGAGAYTKGTIRLKGGTSLFIYVGGKGSNGTVGQTVKGGWNGGGTGEWDHGDDEAGGGGGGATDIRLVGGAWNDFESLKSRIMVAAGGGGGVDAAVGGYGGALTGGSTPHNAGGTQTSGYAFGQGSNGIFTSSNNDVGGGGSGYYGGFAQYKSGGSSYQIAGGGGSSFVSGCVGCNAISKESTSTNIIHTGQPDHYSGYVFTDIVMKAGNDSSMPNFDKTGTMTGNANNGYVRIAVQLDSEEPSEITSLSTDKGDWDRAFDKDVHEYTIELDPLDTKVNVSAFTDSYDSKIDGIGEISIPSGSLDHLVVLTDKYGERKEYTLHFVREINSYKYLDDILINGVSIPDFAPNKFEYDVTVPYNFDFVHITGVTHNQFQKVLNDGVFILEDNYLSQIIVAVPESEVPNQHYTINVTREKSSKLKELNILTLGVDNLKFNDTDMSYELKVFDSLLSLDLEAIPYYKGATITITGNKFLEDNITITSHVDGVEDSTYVIDLTRTSEVSFENSYTCTGAPQEFVAPYSGYYKIALWGAAGGRALDNGNPDYLGGEGAYTSGTILIKQGEALYVNVGCKGGDAGVTGKFKGGVGGYNGGGNGGDDSNQDSAPEPGGGGGGATDVRILNGAWNTPASLRSRIMVAAGASGGADYSLGASGGGLQGYKPYNNNSLATQVGGYAYGYGAAGQNNTSGGGGAGGGYYGGYAASGGYSGGSGSSYISGHDGSIGTTELGTPNTNNYTSLEDSYNYSGKYFTDTTVIDGTGYLWTTSKNRLELMPSPSGGYFASGKGNPNDGYASIKLLKALSNNNYLDSLEVKIGERSLALTPNFETWENEYELTLNSDESVIEVFATAKDKLATVMGTGKHDVAPGNSVLPVTVTSTDGSIRTYNINIYREPSNDPKPLNIKIKGMTNYICSDVDASYCSYTFDPEVEDYEITVPFAITKIELIPVPKSVYQEIVYYGFDGINYEVLDNVDDEGNPNSSLKVDLNSGINKYIVEVIAENGEDSTLYYYDITRDPTGNTDVQDIRIVDPSIEYPFAPRIYEYYITLDENFTKDAVTFEVDKELEEATVDIIGNENLVKGMNDCYVIITAPNGESKTYIYHIYKSASANVYLSNLEVKAGNTVYTLSPKFDKIINDYLLNITSNSDLEIIATPENANAQVKIDKPAVFTSGINQVTITVTNGEANNVYYLNIIKGKNNNANLASLEILEYSKTGKYELDRAFDKDVLDYAITIPKSTRKVKVNAKPEESTTKCTTKGNTSLINNISNITITCVAEDQTSKVYTVTAVKDLSDNNKLKNIEISTGENIGVLNPSFDKDVYRYDVEVGDDVEKINIKGILADASATITGNGYYSLIKGDNLIDLVVTSELGSEQTYTINVHKNLSDDATLKEIRNDQFSEVSHPTSDTYTINVQYDVKKITIEGIANNQNALVSGNGTYNLNTGNNPISITVTSEAGSVANYTVNVVRDLSNNDDLAHLYALEGALNPVFKDTTIFYDVYVGPDVTSLTLFYEPEDAAASVEVKGNENFVVGENTVTVCVTAESGKKKVYTLNVIRQDTTKEVIDELLLSDLQVDHTTLSDFEEKTYIYELTVPNAKTEITIEGTAKNASHVVSGAGTYSLNVGKNALHLAVSNADGIRVDYQLIITREKSDDATLSSLVVKSHALSPKFQKEVISYSLNTSASELEFTSIVPTEKDATYEILNNSSFTTDHTTDVVIRVTSPSGKATIDYTITVTKNPSNNNNLATLEAVGYTLIPEFHKGVMMYTLVVESDVNNLVIKATTEDAHASITGTGLVELNVGSNTIPVKVTSESGNEKTYTILVTKKSNDNNYLQELYVSEGDLSPAFDNKTFEYSLSVPYEVDEISIDGTPEVNTSTVRGLKTYELSVGANSINVVVTSQAGNERIYKLLVTREELVSAKLESLSVKNYDLDTPFNSDYHDYYIDVPNEISSIAQNDISAIPLDRNNAKVEITGNLDDLKIGMNKIEIKVTSTKNAEITETYNLYINRQLSSNNKLISLSVNEGTLSPDFNADVMNYTLDVPNSVDEITVEAHAIASAIINDTSDEFIKTYNLVTGENRITIKVRSMIGIERTYSIVVNRQLSSNDYLSNLEVRNGDDVLKISPRFDKDETNYSLSVDSSIEFITIDASKEDSKSSIEGLGTKELKNEVNTFDIIVTSEANTKKTYTVTVYRTLRSNVEVESIVPSVGQFTEEFNPSKKEYTLNVSEADLFLSFAVQTKDTSAVVTGNSEQVIQFGTSTRTIEITAEDGTKNVYTVTVIKKAESEARLESLSIEHYPFEFDPDTFVYNIPVSYSKRELLESEITATAKDGEATINMMGDLPLAEGIVNIYTIEVIAKDGYTTQTYTIMMTRDSEMYTLRTNKYEIVRNEEEDYVIGIQPSTAINDFENNFENDKEMLHVYLDTVEVVETNLTATTMVIKLEKDDYVYDTLRIIVRGDLNSDGKVNITDQVKIINYVGRTTKFDKYQMLAGDLNFDDKVNIIDQVKMINYVGRTITDLNNKK